MEFYELLDVVQNAKASNIRLFLIIRQEDNNKGKTVSSIQKFAYKAYQIDIDSEIREHLHELTIESVGKQVTNEIELQEYEPITDDTQKAFTYSLSNKEMAFSDIMTRQLKSNVPKIKDLSEVLDDGALWAYCIGYSLAPDHYLYAFRKYSSGKVAIDAEENPEGNRLKRLLQTKFNTESKKLELIHGQTMSLDKQIDCIYYQDTFYVIQKTQFEHIIGIAEEFKEASLQLVKELEKTNQFEGLELLKTQVENKPTLHRKLVRLAKLENHKIITPECIANMQTAAKLENKQVKLNGGKFLIEDENDIDLLIRMLSEYYKTGMIFGKKYGTFAGKVMGE